MSEPVCFCGHVEDEHQDNGTCTIEGCLCAGWEEGGDEWMEDAGPDNTAAGHEHWG